MKVGIISDTHDHLDNLRKALEIFKQKGCEKILHAGDFVSPFVFRVIKEFNIPLIGVFGNNDGEWIYLLKMAEGVGEIKKGPIEIELSGRKIALMHEPVFIEALKKSTYFDLIVYGHTHQSELRSEPVLTINPGECCGYLSGRATIAICDLEELKAELIEL